MIRESLINEYITNHVFPKFREVKHPIYFSDRFFAIGPNDNDRVACITTSFDDNALNIAPFAWVSVKGMFSLSEDETIVTLKRWLSDNFPFLSFDKIQLLRYP